MKVYKNVQGGGVTNLNTSLKNPSKVNSKTFLRPLIASSLAVALGVSVASAGSYYDGTNITSPSSDSCSSGNSPCAYTSQGTFTTTQQQNVLNFSNTLDDTTAYNLTAKGVTIHVTTNNTENSATNAISLNNKIATLNLENSYLKFDDQTVNPTSDAYLHAIKVRNMNARVDAVFTGGSGSETFGTGDKATTYQNLAFYGAFIFQTNNGQQNSVSFKNGANMIGQFRAITTNGYGNANLSFTGGGNLIATQNDSYIEHHNPNDETNIANIKGRAIHIARNLHLTSNNTPLTANISFGESGKQEYVTDDQLLDKDGVITAKLSGSEVQTASSALSAGQTLITNAIKGDVYTQGYGGSKAITNINFYNNGLIEGSISTSSVATINIYFANKGTIRGDLAFSMGKDGTTGNLVIAKSSSDAKVDDLTIEGNIDNQGLTSYVVTAGKFKMVGSAKTGSGKGLTFTTDSATFENFSLENKGTTEITATNSLTLTSSGDINTAGTLTIDNQGSGADSSIDVKGIYGLGTYQSVSNSVITTKGNFNAGILAAVKSDGDGNGTIQTTLNIDNSAIAGDIILSVLDKTSTADNLVFRGGSIKEGATTLTNNGTTLTDRGNIVMFSNMKDGKSEAVLKSGASSSIQIVGDVYTNKGQNNLKIVNTSNNGITIPEFIGNVTVNGGKSNLIFDGSAWAPNNVSELISSTLTPSNSQLASLVSYIKQYGTGKISTLNSGVANIVLRQGANSTFPKQAIFAVDTKGSSYSNILMQKNANATNLNIAASIDYDNQATTRIIFAGSNNLPTATESFTTPNDFTNVGTNGAQMLGVTYKDGVMFEVGAKTDAQRDLIQRYKQIYSGPLLTLGAELSGTTANLTIKGLFMGDAKALASSTSRAGATYNITIRTNAVVAGNIQNQSTDQLNVVMKGGSKIFLDPTITENGGQKYGTTNEFVTVEFQGATHDFNEDLIDSIRTKNTVIDLGTMGVDYGALATQEMGAYNLLKIKTLSGENASFRVRVGDQNEAAKNIGAQASGGTQQLTGFADRVIIEGTGSSQVVREFLQPIYTDNVNVDNIVYKDGENNNIAVLTVKNDSSGNALVNLGALDAIEGFDQISSGLKAVKTDKNGTASDSGDYTTYFLAQAQSKGASQVVSEVTSSALNLNYDLYLANINSLNKRMGELRYNDHSQGAWARVFNGAQTTTFAQETKSTYTTIQAGYDYAFGFEGANNYTGLALSYAMSSTSADSLVDINATSQGIDSVKSQAVEVALYNAYVQDGASVDNGFANGLYSDTILKFSYIMSDFNLIGQSNNYSTNNYALTFSQEVGYRFLLGESKEWFIDPQAELTVGYLNQTDLKQTLESGASLDGVQDSILTLRGRVGANFGYKFDRWTESKGFKAQLYLGTYFEGDYISGGDVSLTTTRGIKTALTPLASTSRGVINVGTNFDVKDQHKIYFDFEKSFGGTIVTDYQVNVGYRFAFGENTGYVPANAVKKEVAPLKVSDEKTQESKESVESTNSETKSEATTEQNTNSTENKAEEKAQ